MGRGGGGEKIQRGTKNSVTKKKERERERELLN